MWNEIACGHSFLELFTFGVSQFGGFLRQGVDEMERIVDNERMSMIRGLTAGFVYGLFVDLFFLSRTRV